MPAGFRPEASPGALYPNETMADFAFIPFGGGARKCIGDQFALMESTVALAMLLRNFDFSLAVRPEEVSEDVEHESSFYSSFIRPVSSK